MASSSTALGAECIEEDDGQSEPALTEAHVRDIFSHWEAGATGRFPSAPCYDLTLHGSVTLVTWLAEGGLRHPLPTTSSFLLMTDTDCCRAASAVCGGCCGRLRLDADGGAPAGGPLPLEASILRGGLVQSGAT